MRDGRITTVAIGTLDVFNSRLCKLTSHLEYHDDTYIFRPYEGFNLSSRHLGQTVGDGEWTTIESGYKTLKHPYIVLSGRNCFDPLSRIPMIHQRYI